MQKTQNELTHVLETYDVVIGIEVHCQLATKRKIFSQSPNLYGSAPNANIDPTCVGLPGALPHLNEACVDLAIRMGLALECDIQSYSNFYRKNYFYPDLPKGYQITQYDKPICLNGHLTLESGKKIWLERIQLEEDAGKNIHVGTASLVDYNRAGVGLIEIITTPCLSCPEEVSEYLKKLHALSVHLEVSYGDMERGHFRADANVSLKPKGSETLGQRCEIKNVNSFKYIEKAVTYEILRQYELLEKGETVERETRGYDSDKNETYLMRSKQSAQDYRFFPEPDLRPLIVSPERIERIRALLPELPWDRQVRLQDTYEIPEYDAKIIASQKLYSSYFESLAQSLKGVMTPKQVSNYFMTEVLRALKYISEHEGMALEEVKEIPIPLKDSEDLLTLVAKETISMRAAKEIFEDMMISKKRPLELLKEKGLEQVSDDDAIEGVCVGVVEAHPKNLEEYLSGKEKLFGFFIGQVMKVSQGKINPAKANDIMKKVLERLRNERE
jgi:aspartyl-tRNA(Asn)/glutamyl-tRNA(Gln) amidotransferase subunit B